jgi:hypothetical protein
MYFFIADGHGKHIVRDPELPIRKEIRISDQIISSFFHKTVEKKENN